MKLWITVDCTQYNYISLSGNILDDNNFNGTL